MKNRWGGLLGFRAGGTTSNMVVSMSACTTQLLEVSLRAVTRTEYLWATVIPTTSIGDASTSVYREKKIISFQTKEGLTQYFGLLTPSTSMIVISWPSIQKKKAANAEVLTMRKRYVFPGSNGKVAFSLNPTLDPEVDVPGRGPK